jgi:hypothetical protein
MTFEEYERLYAAVYAEFAETVRFILAKAIDASPTPQERGSFRHEQKRPTGLSSDLRRPESSIRISSNRIARTYLVSG